MKYANREQSDMMKEIQELGLVAKLVQFALENTQHQHQNISLQFKLQAVRILANISEMKLEQS